MQWLNGRAFLLAVDLVLIRRNRRLFRRLSARARLVSPYACQISTLLYRAGCDVAVCSSFRDSNRSCQNSDRSGKFGPHGNNLESLAFDRGVWPMLEIVLPGKADAVIGFQADPDLQARIEELARKSTEGELTEDERAEYVGYVRANKFVAILKRQAQQIANSRRR